MAKIKIAIADDHTLVRKGYVAMLQADEDFQIVADASNGAELIRMLDAAKTLVDVCLLDVNMPEMNGYETLIALKAKYPAMRFLILTQLEHEYIIVRMLKAGASGYMLKTVEPAELKDAIRSIVHHAYYSNSLVDGRLIGLVQKGDDYKKLAITEREEEFLKLCCSELAYKEIADRMKISERTVAFYRESLFDKLDIKSRTGLALLALKQGVLPKDEM
jgi:two-component system, NarL family, invasion response regulator UvrY